MTEKLTESLWQFALGYYQAARKTLLLRLQQEADMDVLLIIAERWGQARGYGLPNTEQLAEYLAWRTQVIVPLRAVRMQLATHQPLRAQLLTVELNAEQQGLALLAQHWPQATGLGELVTMPYAFLLGEPNAAAVALMQQLQTLN